MDDTDPYKECINEENENKSDQDQSESVIKLLVFPKNSEEYKNELSVLLETKASEISHTTKEILLKFDLTLNNECLIENDIKSLPNLFSGSIESTDYEKYLNVLMHDISKAKLLTPSILEYLISYLEKVNLKDDSCIKNHHMITILYMLLYFFYGENGCNFIKGHENNLDKKTTIIEIGMYLSDLDVSLQDKIEPIFLRTCDFLKNLLHYKKYPILNFKARDMCHHFSIKLDLSLMIRLCIEGVRLENEDIENLVLFIGSTGSGKSTTINYLYGIKYKIVCSKKNHKYYLKQVDKDVIAPAKVGHGNVSETLFPKIIQIKERQPTLSLCDFPGLNDTRDDTYKTCASLGLPIAVHYAKKKSIGAIVVVIDWETIKIDRGEKLLNTIKTVKSLMKDMRNGSVKLLYAITRPPMPPREEDRESDDEGSDFDHEAEYCDSDRLKQKVFKILRSNSRELVEDYNDFKHRNDPEITRLFKNTDDLSYYKAALSKIDISLFESHAHYFGLNIEKGNKAVTKNRILSELKNKLDDSLDQTRTELLEKHIDKILQYLEDNNVHSYSTSEKSRAKIKQVVNDLTNKEIKITSNKILKLSQDINEINEKLEEKKSLIDFLENIELDDIYIIRGFKLNNKWEDHKENLLKRIEEISTQLKNKESQSENELEIDGRSQRFSIVLDWTIRESNRIKTVLNDLVERKEYIEKLIIDINELDERIKSDQNNLRLALVSSRENENEIIENLKRKLNSLDEKKERVDKELEQTSKDIDEMKKSIQDIEESPAIEYGSETIVDKRNKLTQFLGFYTFQTYTFPNYYEKSWSLYDWFIGDRKSHNLPIERVEISFLINKEEKIVFKTPFASNSFENQIDLNSITIVENIAERPFKNDGRIKILIKKENESDFKYTGEVYIYNYKLDDGILEIEYLSHNGEDGFFGVRCYVKPIHFPENKHKIENFRIKISEKEKEKTELEKQLEDVNNEVNENKEHYECAVKGLYDENKGKYLLKFLIDLEYSPDGFFDILLKEIKEEEGDKTDIEWLEKDENLKEVKKAFANYDVMKDHFIELKQMPKNLLQGFIFSKDETKEIEELKKEEQFEADKFDFQRLLRLYIISRKSGLSFIVLRQIVKSLRDQKNTKGRFLKRTLKEEIEKLMNSVNSLKIEKELFEKRKWVIDVLETVVEVLSYRDLEPYIEFRKAKESYDEKVFDTVLESANNIIKRDNRTSN